MEEKPIPAKYNGILFRSRLEARWAIFMDALEVEYRYEPEGFQLPSGWYLPDFYLVQHNCWLEIKPTAPNWEALEKAREFAQHLRARVYLLACEVEVPKNPLFAPGIRFDPDGRWIPGYWWSMDEDSDQLRMARHDTLRVFYDHTKLIQAYKKAKEYRFWNGDNEAVLPINKKTTAKTYQLEAELAKRIDRVCKDILQTDWQLIDAFKDDDLLSIALVVQQCQNDRQLAYMLGLIRHMYLMSEYTGYGCMINYVFKEDGKLKGLWFIDPWYGWSLLELVETAGPSGMMVVPYDGMIRIYRAFDNGEIPVSLWYVIDPEDLDTWGKPLIWFKKFVFLTADTEMQDLPEGYDLLTDIADYPPPPPNYFFDIFGC